MKHYPQRKNTRLKHYDYSQNGWYFVTICARSREHILGEIKNEEMILNENGKIIQTCWQQLPQHYENCILDTFITMPNHVHGIIQIDNNLSTTSEKRKHGLSEIIRGFKTFSSRKINDREKFTHFQWQKSFHDHIIKDETRLITIREYINNNPLKWHIEKAPYHSLQ
ncbi:MAG: transposase [bacterium]